jgi:hypothetical protein
MGKEAEGVLNDNLYRSKLDEFQMAWWVVWVEHLAENGSAYVWGTAEDLWRLWYAGGLGEQGDLTIRNEVVWDKGSGMGMSSDIHHQFATATERALFLMRGQQFLGNQNKEDYWEGYEPLRAWLCEQRDAAGWTNKDICRVTASQMAGHWFTTSQFTIIGRDRYRQLQEAADGSAFIEDYDDLFGRLFPGLREAGNANRRGLSEALRGRRSHFDNTHDNMRDVWEFSRVTGEERAGHPTPKPVPLVARAVKTSCPEGGIVAVPFGGSGSDLIACATTGRIARIAELDPGWCDVIRDRWTRWAIEAGQDPGPGALTLERD